MIDIHGTIRAMRGLWQKELNDTGRCVTNRMVFEVHPTTYHALCEAIANDPTSTPPGSLAYHLARLFPAGELKIDDIPVTKSLGLRPGMVRLVIAARETEVVEIGETFDDEKGRKQ